jgi:Zn-dependent protease/predicted transcriptional regulator
VKSQIKLGTIFGVELGLHYSWIVIALLITFSLAAQFHAVNRDWTDTVVWATAILTGLLFFACLFAHELSHALVARARGLPIHKITLFLLGGVAQMEKEAADPKTEFWMAIAGPITSAALGFILLEFARLAGWVVGSHPLTPGTALLVWLGYINLMLAAFNMIPGFPLDGGRVLRAIVWWFTGNVERSTRVAARIGQVIAVLFIAFGVFRFFEGAGLGGLWLAFIGWFLLQASSATYLQVRTGTLLRDLHIKDLMSVDFEVVSPNMSLQEFVNDRLMRTGRRCFLVMENGQLLGMVTPKEIRDVNPSIWQFKQVHDVMRPASQIHLVAPDTPAMEALEIMSREDVHQLPVVSNGRLVGVVTRAHLLEILRSRSELSDITHLPRAA